MIIEIEGPDGVGKTTLAKALAERLGAVYLKFPDRSTISGQLIERMLRSGGFDPTIFQSLQQTNRLEKLAVLQMAAACRSIHVVCDRYQVSALVYGLADGLPKDWLQTLVRGTPAADFHVLLVCDPLQIERERLKGRDREEYERRGVEGFRRQQSLFADVCCELAQDNSRWHTYGTHLWSPAQILDAVEHNVQRIVKQL